MVIKHYDKINVPLINDIIVDEENTVWVATDKGLGKIINDSLDFISQDEDKRLLENLNTICLDHDILWLGTYQGEVIKMENGTTQVIDCREFVTGDSAFLVKDIVVTIENNQKILWLATDKKYLIKYNLNSVEKSQKIKLPDIINNLYLDAADNIWMGGSNGLYLLEKKKKVKPIYKKGQVHAIQGWKEEIYFLSSESDGYSYFQKYNTKTKYINPNPLNLDNKATRSNLVDFKIDTSSNKIYFVGNGLVVYNPALRQEKKWRYYNEMNEQLKVSSVLCLELDAENTIWLGTEGKGLYNCYQKDSTKKEVNNSEVPPSVLPKDAVKVACGSPVTAGTKKGANVLIDLGRDRGKFILNYDMYARPDELVIKCGDKEIYSTKGAVAGKKSVPIDISCRNIQVIVKGGERDTKWFFQITCPEN